jgi:ribosomal protein S18 acetylase RimI-like enzyme
MVRQDEDGLDLIETRERWTYQPLVEALTCELGPEFGQAMDWWCGIGERLYSLPFWKVLAAVDAEGRAQAVIGLYQEQGAPKDEFWVGWFGVLHGWRRRGIGTRLLAHVAAEAKQRGGRILRLYTSPDNDGGIGFYERMGFVRTGTMADHDGEQAASDGTEIVMSRVL